MDIWTFWSCWKLEILESGILCCPQCTQFHLTQQIYRGNLISELSFENFSDDEYRRLSSEIIDVLLGQECVSL